MAEGAGYSSVSASNACSPVAGSSPGSLNLLFEQAREAVKHGQYDSWNHGGRLDHTVTETALVPLVVDRKRDDAAVVVLVTPEAVVVVAFAGGGVFGSFGSGGTRLLKNEIPCTLLAQYSTSKKLFIVV